MKIIQILSVSKNPSTEIENKIASKAIDYINYIIYGLGDDGVVYKMNGSTWIKIISSEDVS